MRTRNHHGPSLFSTLGQALNFNFHHSSPERAPRCKDDPQAATFEAMVLERLSGLEASSKQGFSLAWMDKALILVTSIISDAQLIIPGLACPLSEWDERWVSKYLEDTCRLLDVLNTSRKVVGDFEHRMMLLDLAVSTLSSKHGTNQERLAKARECLNEFKAQGASTNDSWKKAKVCCGILREMLEQREIKERTFLSAVYAAKVVAVFVLGMVVVLLSSGRVTLGFTGWEIADSFAWSKPLRGLFERLRSSMQRSIVDASPLVAEFAALESTVTSLELKLGEGRCFRRQRSKSFDFDVRKGQVMEKSRKSVDLEMQKLKLELELELDHGAFMPEEDIGLGVVRNLENVLNSAEGGLDRVRQDMDKLFHIIVFNRNSLLSYLRQGESAGTQGRHIYA